MTGPQFRRVTLPEPRRGILGQGSILTLTSIADRTSPVQRGKWILEVLLGSPPPPPPPNVPALEETSGTSGGKVLSVRERMEEHRKNPACTSCHKVIDPLGLALEHFDATGRYRIKDNEVPVDAVGDLYDGTRMDGAAGLRSALLEAQGRVPAQLHRAPDDLRARAPRRGVGHAGGAAVIRQAAPRNYKISAFVQGSWPATVPEERRAPRDADASAHDAGRSQRSAASADYSGSAAQIEDHETIWTMLHHARPPSRRTVLKGLGVTVALPLLEAMVPAGTAYARAADRKLRLIAIEMVHGAAGSTTYGAG